MPPESSQSESNDSDPLTAALLGAFGVAMVAYGAAQLLGIVTFQPPVYAYFAAGLVLLLWGGWRLQHA